MTSTHSSPPDAMSDGAGRILPWAVFLATSWTWCIGMFLPVLLLRDYGLWGFVAFAVPNVLGAAAMGWVLAGRHLGPASLSDSHQLVSAHRLATGAFSLITIAFQVYFLVWLLGYLRAEQLPAVILAAGGFAAAAAVLRTRAGGGRLILATLAFLASLAIATTMLIRGWLALPQDLPTPRTQGLLWVAPIAVFGFALCPYLDLTFHRARRSLPGPAGTAAFFIGFGILFLAMILLTLGYAGILMPMAGVGEIGAILPAALSLVAAHIIVQLFITVDLHMRELNERIPAAGPGSGGSAGLTPRMVLIAVAVLAPAVLGVIVSALPGALGLSAGELGYRAFMAFYGLVFPAYVWICVIPARGERLFAPPSREKIRVFAFAVGVAIPMFWLGFMHRQELWLAPGLIIVLLARLAVPRRP